MIADIRYGQTPDAVQFLAAILDVVMCSVTVKQARYLHESDPLGDYILTKIRKVDPVQVRDHIESVLESSEQVFEKFFLSKFIGLEFDYLPETAADTDKDHLRISFEVTEMLMNPQGSLHGGIIAAVMDISMGHLLHKTAGMGITIEMKTQYLRPVLTGRATVEGRFIKKGRSLSFMESRLWGSDGKLAAMTTATWKMPG